MITATRLLYAHRWKDLTMPTMEVWFLKMIELAQMAKLIILIIESTLIFLNADRTLFETEEK